MDPTIVIAILGVVSTVGAVLITGWFNRRQQAAQTERITAEAHALIYKEYNHLLVAQRTDSQLAREHAQGAEEGAAGRAASGRSRGDGLSG